jgi:hypothetical protein
MAKSTTRGLLAKLRDLSHSFNFPLRWNVHNAMVKIHVLTHIKPDTPLPPVVGLHLSLVSDAK